MEPVTESRHEILTELLNKVFTRVITRNDCNNVNKDHIMIFSNDEEEYTFIHDQDCCEWVHIEDICGDLNDLVGQPLLMAEKVTGEIKNDKGLFPEHDNYIEWTFYKFATIKGSVTVRWLGSSNGYYSTGVSLYKTFKEN